MSETLSDWDERVLEMVAFLRRPSDTLEPLIRLPARAEGDQADRLADLMTLRKRLGLTSPTVEATRTWATQLAAWMVQQEPSVRSASTALALGMDNEVESLLKQGVQDDNNRCLLRSDFGEFGLYQIPENPGFLFGDTSKLPPSHWGRALMPEEDLYVLGGRQRCLALGMNTQRWFPEADVIDLTQNWRRHQIQDAEQREMMDRSKAANERYRLAQTEAGRLAELERTVAGLKQQLAEHAGSNGAVVK